MEKMVVVVFDNQPKAYEGLQIFKDLDSEGQISLYDVQIIQREPDGHVRVIENQDRLAFPIVGGGAAVGALVGLLGGPLGALAGAAVGALIGSIGEMEKSGVTDEFVKDVSDTLTAGKVAVIADISENWVTPLDTEMERIGGVVFRRTRDHVERMQEDRDADAHRAEMEQLKAERTQARGERLAKIDARIDHARGRMESAIERKRVHQRLDEQEREAKIQALQKKAQQAQGEVRRRRTDLLEELRHEYTDKVAAH